VENSHALQNAKIAQAHALSLSSTPARILVVDDDAHIRQFNAEILKRFGYQIDLAEDGASAWEALQSDGFDLLITDYNMPKLTGLDLIKKLRAARMPLPVILMSGAMPVSEIEQDADLRAVVTITKPFSAKQLLVTVNLVLSPSPSA
jgi:DNA-binding response OmpR family regulator